MNIEQIPKIERISPSKEKLLALESKGKYVFHGSPVVRAILRPKQAKRENKETGSEEDDGDPAVFATPYADLAIFRSLVNTEGVAGPSKNGFGIDDEKRNFSASKNLLEAAKGKIGKVYVFDKDQFYYQEEGMMECRSEKPVVPLEIVEDTVDDLPENVEIIEGESVSGEMPRPEQTALEISKLGDFDMEYFHKLEGENGWIAFGLDNCKNQRYFTVLGSAGEKIGIIGIYDTDEDKNVAHIVVDGKYRGRGLAPKIYQKIVDELNLPFIILTINLTNASSIRAAEKMAGIDRVSDAEYEKMYQKAKYIYRSPGRQQLGL